MGCDGGSFVQRSELVKTKKRAQKQDASVEREAKWFMCALSKEQLKEPIVSCPLGKLYNKEAMLEYLLKTNTFGDAEAVCGHVDSIKQLTTLNLTVNPAFTKQDTISMNTSNDVNLKAQFICPVSMKEMNGNNKFSYISTCGCVFCDQALEQVESSACLKCGKPFSKDDLIPLNSNDPKEVEKLEQRIKKKKKSKRKKTSDEAIELALSKKPNIPLPELKPVKLQSEAIKSLYSKDVDPKKISNNLFSGTFNRYASYN